MRWGPVSALAIFVALISLPSPATAATPPLSRGVTIQEPLTAGDSRRIREAGIETVRFQVSWQATEVRPGEFDWSQPDRYVKTIGEAGATPLPFFEGVPAWLPEHPSRSPLASSPAQDAWSSFVAAMVRRYGPGGDAQPPVPIRTWQLWNEPNLDFPWGGPSDPGAYGRLVEAGANSIRAVDPNAKIMLAGLAPAARGIKPWSFMRRLVRTLDPAAWDIAAVHPYARTVGEVGDQVAKLRRRMASAGARRKPLAVTELGWSSSRLSVPTLAGTAQSQARKLKASFRRLAGTKQWRISEILWYSLRDTPSEPDNCGFCTSSGLLRTGGAPKPAWIAFRELMGVQG